MDHVILLHFSGSVSEQFKLVSIRRQVLTFENPPSFTELIARVRAVMNVRCDLPLHRKYDMYGNKPVYVTSYLVLPLKGSDNEKIVCNPIRQAGTPTQHGNHIYTQMGCRYDRYLLRPSPHLSLAVD
jgi:hypothetical protein